MDAICLLPLTNLSLCIWGVFVVSRSGASLHATARYCPVGWGCSLFVPDLRPACQQPQMLHCMPTSLHPGLVQYSRRWGLEGLRPLQIIVTSWPHFQVAPWPCDHGPCFQPFWRRKLLPEKLRR